MSVLSRSLSLYRSLYTHRCTSLQEKQGMCVCLSLSLRFLSSFFLVVVAAPAALYIPQSSGQLIEILMDFFSLGASLGHELPAPIADYHQRGTCKIGILLSSSFSILPVSLSLSPSHWLCHYDRDHQEPTDHLLIATKLYSPLYFFLSLSFFLLYFATTTSVCHGMYTFRLTFSLSRSFPPVGDSVSACWLHGCCLAFPFLFFFPSPSSSLFVFRTTFMSLIHRVLYGTRYFLSLTHSHKTIFKAVFFFFLFCPPLCLFDVL